MGREFKESRFRAVCGSGTSLGHGCVRACTAGSGPRSKELADAEDGDGIFLSPPREGHL